MSNNTKDRQPLSITNPELAKEWDYIKNAPLTPNDVTAGSGNKVWWKCSKGHEWQATIFHRNPHNAIKGTGCPICSGKKVMRGYNDLQTKRPDIANEWNYDKNIDSQPYDFTYKSNKTVWWKCQYGHEWKAKISDRTRGNGCPFCSGRGTSLPEQGIAFYLESVCSVERRIKIARQEIDVYLPDYKIGIEYDGRFFHSTKSQNRELIKDQIVSENGIKLIRIKESDQNRIDNSIIYFETDYLGPNYEWAIRQLCHMLVLYTGDKCFDAINVNAQKDVLKIRERINTYLKDNSISALRPDLANEWNNEKNNMLKPEMFTLGAQTRVWWKCIKGHEWKSSIANRVKGNSCPYCSGHKPIKGETDLETLFPEIAKEWHPIKNGKLTAREVSPNCNKKIWWQCSKGHEWQTSANTRISNKSGCPVCSGKKVLAGFNDLATVMPEIAKEWHPTKNGDLTPLEVTRASDKRVWWLCPVCGYEYQSVIGNRTVLDRGCPRCGRKQQADSYIKNRLAKNGTLKANYPEIAKEWNIARNGKLTPDDVLPGSNKRVWWKCDKGHEWQTMVSNRVKGHGCPICSGHKVLDGFNDLATTDPEIAKEWNYEKNAPLTPSDFTAGSSKKVWWRCQNGHEWQASICHRAPKSNSRGTGCPLCSRNTSHITRIQTIIRNVGTLLDTNPSLAKEWHPDKNGSLKPIDYTAGSHVKVWWKCPRGHEWQATISSRTRGNGCPYCSDKAHKKVLCIETNTIFESLSEASYETCGSTKYVTNISNACKGKRKSACGYHWKFVESNGK